jgi:hypothetical protein
LVNKVEINQEAFLWREHAATIYEHIHKQTLDKTETTMTSK